MRQHHIAKKECDVYGYVTRTLWRQESKTARVAEARKYFSYERQSENTVHRDNVIALFLKVYRSAINTVCSQKEYGAGFGSPK